MLQWWLPLKLIKQTPRVGPCFPLVVPDWHLPKSHAKCFAISKDDCNLSGNCFFVENTPTLLLSTKLVSAYMDRLNDGYIVRNFTAQSNPSHESLYGTPELSLTLHLALREARSRFLPFLSMASSFHLYQQCAC